MPKEVCSAGASNVMCWAECLLVNTKILEMTEEYQTTHKIYKRHVNILIWPICNTKIRSTEVHIVLLVLADDLV